MNDYIARMDGAVEMVHIPPHTPQLNPIEIEWREIRAAIADIFFGGLDRMLDAIIRMFHNGEMSIVRLFDWLLPPPWLARPLSERHPVRPTPAGLLRPAPACAVHPEGAYRCVTRWEGAT